MSDIFISYKNEDRPRAKIIAEALEQQGFSIWWDRNIPPGKTFDEVIEQELRAAKCVVVLWSIESVSSDWVKNEAREGKRRHILVPVLIDNADNVKIPFEFRHIQAAQLIDWQGALPNPEFYLLLKSVAEIIDLCITEKVTSPEQESPTGQISTSKVAGGVQKNKHILGIDLGTYNSTAAVLVVDSSGKASEPRIILGSQADKDKSEYQDESECQDSFEKLKAFPSFVSYYPDGSVDKVGLVAKKRLIKDPQHVVWGVKRLLGKTYTEAKDHGELERFSYTIEPDPETGKCLIVIGARKYKPEDVIGEILKEIKKEAEKEIGVSFSDVIISIPAYFDAIHATPIVQAAQISFNSIKTIPEPIAASIAYNMPVNLKPLHVLVFDLGAGTLDVTAGNLIRKGSNPDDVTFQSKITTGNTHLGGVDMDDRIKRLLIKKSGLLTAKLSDADKNKIRRKAEMTKIHLSKEPKVAVEFKVKYLFSWDEIPGNDNGRLKEFLSQKFGIDWVKTAKIEKIDDGKTIQLSNELNSISLKLDNEKPEVNLKIDNGKTDKFITELESGKLNIYNNSYSFDISRPELEMALRGHHGEMDIIEECRKQVIEAIKGAYWTPDDIEQILLIGGPSCMPSILQMLKEVFRRNPKILSQLEQMESGKLPVDPMEAVAKGAALSSETRKIIPHPYGYGFVDTKLEPKQIIDNPRILIPRGSTYPCMSEPYMISWYRKAATTEIEIIQHVPETENPPEYRHLGVVDIANKELGKSPIEITMGLNDNGELITKLHDTKYGKEVQYIGMSTLRRIPIKLPRKRERPGYVEPPPERVEVDDVALNDLVNWAQTVLKLCSAKMEDVDLETVTNIRSFVNDLNYDFVFYVRDNKGNLDLKKAKEHWNDILNDTNPLLHRAAELGIIESNQIAELKRQGEAIKDRLLKFT